MTADLSASANEASTSSNSWTRILEGVAHTETSTRRNIVVCGESSTDRIAVVDGLKHGFVDRDGSNKSQQRSSFGLGYEYADIKDEDEIVARLGIYSVPSASAPYDALLDVGILPAALQDTLFMVLLDWSDPSTFVPQLGRWFGVLHKLASPQRQYVQAKPGDNQPSHLNSARERLELIVRNYVEPAHRTDGTTLGGPPPTLIPPETMALPPGSLVDNLGLNIVMVCCNSHLMDHYEKRNLYKEETLDYIQQTLRVLCLRYGAALVFSSIAAPENLQKLRQYALHRLFGNPTALPSHSTQNTPAANIGAQGLPIRTSSTRTFNFPHRANAIDRDALFIPTGWDSLGKIRVIRELNFDPDTINAQWERLISERTGAHEANESGDDLQSAYARVVHPSEASADQQQRVTKQGIKTARSEQEFLKSQSEFLQKEAAKDPRSAFGAKTKLSLHSADNSTTQGLGIGMGSGSRDAAVGPLSSSALDLPSVERALDRDRESRQASDRHSQNLGRDATSPPLSSMRSPMTASSMMSPQASATSPKGATSPGGQTQNEVLASFFQSLLSARKDSGGVQRNATKSSSGSAAPAGQSSPAR